MESKGDPLPVAPERYGSQRGDPDEDVSMLWNAASAATNCSGLGFISTRLQVITPTAKRGSVSKSQEISNGRKKRVDVNYLVFQQRPGVSPTP